MVGGGPSPSSVVLCEISSRPAMITCGCGIPSLYKFSMMMNLSNRKCVDWSSSAGVMCLRFDTFLHLAELSISCGSGGGLLCTHRHDRGTNHPPMEI